MKTAHQSFVGSDSSLEMEKNGETKNVTPVNNASFPVYQDDMVHQQRGCGGRLSYKMAKLLQLFFLLAALGCSIAPMTAVYKGWAYYHTDAFYFKTGVVPSQLASVLPLIATAKQQVDFVTVYANPAKGFYFEFWVGYIKGTSTLRQWENLSFLQCRNIDFSVVQAKAPAAVGLLRQTCLPEYRYLKEEDMSGQVWGGFTCAILGLGGLTAFLLALITLASIFTKGQGLTRRFSARWMWWFYLVWGILYFIFAVGMYLFLLIGVHRETERQLQWGCRPKPAWAFYVALAGGVSWFIVAAIQRGRASPTAVRKANKANANLDVPYV